jgi:hypothetical protein
MPPSHFDQTIETVPVGQYRDLLSLIAQESEGVVVIW